MLNQGTHHYLRASLNLSYSTIIKEGYGSNLYQSSFYGLNAAINIANASTAVIDNVNITVHNGAANVFAYGEGTVVTISNSDLYSSGPVSHGLCKSCSVFPGDNLLTTEKTVLVMAPSTATIFAIIPEVIAPHHFLATTQQDTFTSMIPLPTPQESVAPSSMRSARFGVPILSATLRKLRFYSPMDPSRHISRIPI